MGEGGRVGISGVVALVLQLQLLARLWLSIVPSIRQATRLGSRATTPRPSCGLEMSHPPAQGTVASVVA